MVCTLMGAIAVGSWTRLQQVRRWLAVLGLLLLTFRKKLLAKADDIGIQFINLFNCKGHMKLKDVNGYDDAQLRLRNKAADVAAKKGAALHLVFALCFDTIRYEFAMTVVPYVARYLA